MHNYTWIGNAPLVQQVKDYLFGGTWESSDVILITIGSKTVSTTAGSTTTNTVVDNLVTTWNALTAADGYPEFAEITASRSGSNFRLTADVAGYPMGTITILTTEADGGAADAQTIDGSAVSSGTVSTANSGPNDWSVKSNWSGGAVPQTGDNVYIDLGSVSILYGLLQSTVTLALLQISQRYTGKIGLPKRNTVGTAYEEYRTTHLTIGATTLTVGTGIGTGSGRIKISNSSIQTAATVLNTGTGLETGVPALCWKGTHASNVLNVYGGDVGVASFAAETATIATLRQTSGTLLCGTGTTLATVNKSGGTLTINSATTALTNGSGDTNVLSAAHTAITVNGGTVNYDSTGTCTTLTINNNGIANFSRRNAARTVTNCTVNDNGAISDPFDVVTFTNPVAWKGILRVSPQ